LRHRHHKRHISEAGNADDSQENSPVKVSELESALQLNRRVFRHKPRKFVTSSDVEQRIRNRAEVSLSDSEKMRLDFEMKQFDGGLASAKEEADAICSGNQDTIFPITMVTIMVGVPRLQANKLRANRLRYCLRHGLQYCEYSKQLDPSRSLEWSKLLAVRGMFSIGHKVVAWIDPEAVIMDMTRSLPYIISRYPKKDVIIPTRNDVCRGCANPFAPIDDGVFVMKNTEYSNSMLEWLYADNVTSPSLVDKGQGTGAITDYRSHNIKSWRRHVAVVPWKMINSYHQLFGAGDFIMHWDDDRASASRFDVLVGYLDATGAPPNGRRLLELFPSPRY